MVFLWMYYALYSFDTLGLEKLETIQCKNNLDSDKLGTKKKPFPVRMAAEEKTLQMVDLPVL